MPQVFKDKPWILWGGIGGVVLFGFMALRRRSAAPTPPAIVPGPSAPPTQGTPSGNPASGLQALLAHLQETQASGFTRVLAEQERRSAAESDRIALLWGRTNQALSELMHPTSSGNIPPPVPVSNQVSYNGHSFTLHPGNSIEYRRPDGSGRSVGLLGDETKSYQERLNFTFDWLLKQ